MDLRKLSKKLSQSIMDATKELKEFVKEHDGFILTDDVSCDILSVCVYDERSETFVEKFVKAVFIYKDKLYACVDNYTIRYTSKEAVFEEDDNWYPLEEYSDLLYDSAILTILEIIEEYV